VVPGLYGRPLKLLHVREGVVANVAIVTIVAGVVV
jgi:hypothetical protein